MANIIEAAQEHLDWSGNIWIIALKFAPLSFNEQLNPPEQPKWKQKR